jgi:hypothetical protein
VPQFQYRLASPRVPVIERGGDDAARLEALDAVVTGARARNAVFDEPQRILDRLPVRVGDQLTGLRVTHRPQHADRLRHRERQIEPGHRMPGRTAIHRGVCDEGSAQRLPGDGITAGVQRGQRVLGHH